MVEMEYVEVPRSPAKEPAVLADMRIEVSPRRWAVLGVFVLYCMSTNYQWVHYTIVGDLVARYYGITASQVDWTSIVYMAALVVFMLPISFLLDNKGVGWSMKFGVFLLALGSWLKVFAVAPGRFPLALLGQTLVGISQVFELCAPPRIAAVWFGARELSTACAIGILGNEIGAAIGFLTTPLLVQPHVNPGDIGEDLKFIMLVTAGTTTLVFLLTMLLFKDRPKLPPNPMQALERCSATPVTLKEFCRSIGTLLANKNFLIMLVSTGISGGALNVLGTVLNPVILKRFPDGQEFAGRVGLVMMIFGIIGVTLMGILLDKTHKFKEITLAIFILQVASTVGFAYTLIAKNVFLVYVTAGLLGMTVFGYVVLSFETSAEVTYPSSESTMGGLLLIPSNMLGCVMTMTFTWTLERWGDLAANMFMTASLVVGAIITAFITKDYRRLAANRTPTKCCDPVALAGA